MQRLKQPVHSLCPSPPLFPPLPLQITALGQAVNTEIDLMLEAKEKEISTA